MKPRAATSAWAGRTSRLLAVDADLDLLEVGVAAQRGHLGVGDDLDAGVLDRATVRSWARNASRRCTSVTDARDRLEVLGPVEGAVAAADDDHVLAGVRREAGHEELHAPPDPARRRPAAAAG